LKTTNKGEIHSICFCFNNFFSLLAKKRFITY